MWTYKRFDDLFPTDDACKRYIVGKRWPDGVSCPRCGNFERVYALKARPFHWSCKQDLECGGRNGYRFSVISGTIFQDTKIPLTLWFKIGYLMLTAKKGISSLSSQGHFWRGLGIGLADYLVHLPSLARCHAWRCLPSYWRI